MSNSLFVELEELRGLALGVRAIVGPLTVDRTTVIQPFDVFSLSRFCEQRGIEFRFNPKSWSENRVYVWLKIIQFLQQQQFSVQYRVQFAIKTEFNIKPLLVSLNKIPAVVRKLRSLYNAGLNFRVIDQSVETDSAKIKLEIETKRELQNYRIEIGESNGCVAEFKPISGGAIKTGEKITVDIKLKQIAAKFARIAVFVTAPNFLSKTIIVIDNNSNQNQNQQQN